MKNYVVDCPQNVMFKELLKNGRWTAKEGLSQRFYEGRTDEHMSLPHFPFLLLKAT